MIMVISSVKRQMTSERQPWYNVKNMRFVTQKIFAGVKSVAFINWAPMPQWFNLPKP